MANKPEKYELLYLDPGEYPLWDRFVYESPLGTIFHTTSWGNVVEKTFKRPFKILTVKMNNSIQAGILCFPKESLGIRSITQIAATTYQGILFKSSASEKASHSRAQVHDVFSLILPKLKSDFQFIEVPLPPGTDDVRPYLWQGFMATPQYTYRFRIDPFDELSKNFSQSLRRKINVSLKKENHVSTSEDPLPLSHFIFDSYLHHQLAPPLSREQLIQMLSICIEMNMGTLFYLYLDDQPIAGLFILHDQKCVYALFSGIHNQYRNQSYTEYLHAVALQIPDHNQKVFDFLGANTIHFEQFKRSFGGSLDLYFRVRYVKNRAIEQMSIIRRLQHHLARYRPGKTR